MRKFMQFVGRILFTCAWPAFWVYYRVGHGRTRVVLVHGGKVLVMKQWISEGLWHLPGGGLHKDEDVAAGAVREVYEETGVRISPDHLQPLGKATGRQRGQQFEYFMFAAEVSSAKVSAQWYEVAEAVWIYPNELNRSNATPDTLHTLQAVRQHTSLLQ